MAANKGGYAFALDPDTERKVWVQDVGKATQSYGCFGMLAQNQLRAACCA